MGIRSRWRDRTGGGGSPQNVQPLVEQLEPRVLLDANLAGFEFPVLPDTPSSEHAIYVDLAQPDQDLQPNNASLVLEYLASSDESQEDDAAGQPLHTSVQPVETDPAEGTTGAGMPLRQAESGVQIAAEPDGSAVPMQGESTGLVAAGQRDSIANCEALPIAIRGPPIAELGAVSLAYESSYAIEAESCETLAGMGAPCESGLTAPQLPGLQLVDPDISNWQGQVIYLDFDGAKDVIYNGPVTVGPFDVPAFQAPGELAGQEQLIIDQVLIGLQETFAGSGVVFTTQQPRQGVEYSTICIGGDDSAFSQYGSFQGLAEQVDVGNQDASDEGLVFSENFNGTSAQIYAEDLTDVVAHEVAHLLGYGHDCSEGSLGVAPVLARMAQSQDGRPEPIAMAYTDTGQRSAISDPSAIVPLKIVLVSDAVAQAEQIQRTAVADTIAIVYDSDTMTASRLVDLLSSVSAAHNGAPIGHLGIVAHGGPGEVHLGREENLSLTAMPSRAAELKRLQFLLTPDARLELYSCSVAAGAHGKAFVDELAGVTGATVFGSDNPVGTVPRADLIWEYRTDSLAETSESFLILQMETIPGVHLTDRTEPATITVGTYPSGPATTVAFNTYVEDVLPNEWPSGYYWPAEAYKAGAIAAKMYGWYHIKHPLSSAFDLYSDDHSQVYVSGSGQSASAVQTTTPTVAAVRSVGMERGDGQLFPAEYWDGACNVSSPGGARLRSSASAASDDNIITTLANDTRVYVIDNGEHYADGHWWVQVAVSGVYPSSTTHVGYVASDLLDGVSIAGSVANMRGRVTQYGTVYWANQGWDYQQILHYFYDGSTKTDGQNIEFFSVAVSSQDAIPPTIDDFYVDEPYSVVLGGSFTIHYELSDTGGSGLNRVELWRTGTYPTWPDEAEDQDPVSGNGPVEGTFSDTPPSVGEWWYGIHVVDNEQDKTGEYTTEQDCGLTPISVTVTQPKPDLQGSTYDCPESLVARQSFDITFSFDNDGDADAAGFDVDFYLSRDSNISTMDKYLGRHESPGLPAASSTAELTKTLVLPDAGDVFWNGDGAYHLGMVIDAGNSVAESDETNNANRGDGHDWDAVHITGTSTAPPNQSPSVGSLGDSPDPVIQGNNLTLVANSVSDSDGMLVKVEFYRDTNGNGAIDVGADVLLGADASSSGGWTWTGSTGTFPLGTNTYMARAQDDDSAWSNTAITTGMVAATPSTISILADKDSMDVAEGLTATFRVRLSGPPPSDVVVSVNRVSGEAEISIIEGATLTFTEADWSTYQTVTLLVELDPDSTDDIATIECSGPGLTSCHVLVREQDNCALEIILSNTSLYVGEGSTATFGVRLSLQPDSDVVVTVGRVGGDSDIFVSEGASLTFTPSNGKMYQTVTVSARKDPDTFDGVATIRCRASGLADKDVAATEQDDGTSPVYRFWSPVYSRHFYTISEAEKNKLIDKYSHVWTYERIAFYAYAEGFQPIGTLAVHRFWSPRLKCHFYTISKGEKDKLIDLYPHAWTYEDIAWYAYGP